MDEVKKYHCGTLTYTKAGLAVLFSWILWGDFCFTLMEIIIPSILPLKLSALGAPNWLMGMILTGIPGVLNMFICPYVSFKSDRYRSRWGRRIPFIIVTMPFLCISLVMMGYADEISSLLQKYLHIASMAPATFTLVVIVLLVIIFRFFNAFVDSIFWYLFNDVIPAQFLARFIGAFRIVGAIAGAGYNYFIFKYAESHMREIFLSISILYFLGFGAMCLMVKEGEYPPINVSAEKGKKESGLRIFFEECFTHKFYWVLFLFSSALVMGDGIRPFMIFFQQEMGMTLDNIGKYNAVMGIASILAMYLASIYVDRWHPVRTFAYICVFSVIGYAFNWVWFFVRLPGEYFFWLYIGNGLITTFQAVLLGACYLPLNMRLFPKSRYGQFCSAKSIIKSTFTVIAGLASGLFIDGIRWFYGGSTFAYRFIFVWLTFFSIIAAWLGVKLYLHWHRLGGDDHYHPPAPWSKYGIEELEGVPYGGVSCRGLNIGLYFFSAVMWFSLLSLPFLLAWMYWENIFWAVKWNTVLVLPLSILACWWWRRIEKKIRSGIEFYGDGEVAGIPHHGVLIVIGIQSWLGLILWIAQVVVSINLHLDVAAFIFSLANVVTNFMLIISVLILCRIERRINSM